MDQKTMDIGVQMFAVMLGTTEDNPRLQSAIRAVISALTNNMPMKAKERIYNVKQYALNNLERNAIDAFLAKFD